MSVTVQNLDLEYLPNHKTEFNSVTCFRKVFSCAPTLAAQVDHFFRFRESANDFLKNFLTPFSQLPVIEIEPRLLH